MRVLILLFSLSLVSCDPIGGSLSHYIHLGPELAADVYAASTRLEDGFESTEDPFGRPLVRICTDCRDQAYLWRSEGWILISTTFIGLWKMDTRFLESEVNHRLIHNQLARHVKSLPPWSEWKVQRWVAEDGPPPRLPFEPKEEH